MTPLEVFAWLLEQLEAGERAGVWTVVQHRGSSPGRAGFFLGVTDNASVGTVGGGVMEARLLDTARQRLRDGLAEVVLTEQVHRDDAAPELQSGLICSGEQRLAFVPLGAHHRETLQGIVAGLQAGNAVRLELSGEGLGAHVQDTLAEDTPPRLYASESGFRFETWIGPRHTVYVFGSGHVGQAVCRALAPLDFHVVAFDDRPDLEQVRGNRYPQELVTGPYASVRDHVRAGCRAFGVVVTAQRDHDIEVLRQVADLPFRYLGVMGSPAKLAVIRKALIESGIDGKHVAGIRGPIGMPIGAETPAEIAASIVAELVAVRRGS